MLSEEHTVQLANAMVLLDLVEKVRLEGNATEELKALQTELKKWIDGVMSSLNQEEQNQAMDRYTKERTSGEIKSLPNLLAKFSK